MLLTVFMGSEDKEEDWDVMDVIDTGDSPINDMDTGVSPKGVIDMVDSPDCADIVVDGDEESKLTTESHSCSVRQTPAAAISASEAAEPVSTGNKRISRGENKEGRKLTD